MRRVTQRPNPPLSDLVDEHMLVTIELGINDGYIVTIGETSGIECANIWAAVRSARSAVRKAAA